MNKGNKMFVLNKWAIKAEVVKALDGLNGGFDSETLKRALEEVSKEYPHTTDKPDTKRTVPPEALDHKPYDYRGKML